MHSMTALILSHIHILGVLEMETFYSKQILF